MYRMKKKQGQWDKFAVIGGKGALSVRISEPNKCPNNHDHSSAESEFLRRKQRSDVRQVDLLQIPLYRGRSICPLRLTVSKDFAGFQIFDCQWRCLAVPARHFVYNSHSLLVIAFAHVILRRFVDREQDESDEEHHHGDPAHCDEEVAPTHVLRTCAELALLASKHPIAAKEGEMAAMSPKTLVTPSVKLKAHLHPKISHPNPQNIAPARSPMFWASVNNGGLEG